MAKGDLVRYWNVLDDLKNVEKFKRAGKQYNKQKYIVINL